MSAKESNMSSNANRTGRRFAFIVIAAGIVAAAAVVAATPSLAQTAPAGGTTTLQRGSEAEKALNMKEGPQTREERLNAKPLDWNSTIGTPTPRTLTAKERRALRTAKPAAASGGAPNPKAEEEARKLHPDDWK
jgi:hypothetical protein